MKYEVEISSLYHAFSRVYEVQQLLDILPALKALD